MRSHRLTPYALGIILAVAGCADEDLPTTNDYNDVATVVGNLVSSNAGASATFGGETTSFADAMLFASGRMPAGFQPTDGGRWAGRPGGVPNPIADYYRGTRGGMNYDYAVTCKDASGATLPTCDATTDWAHVRMSWSGKVDRPGFGAEVSREGEWTISGLQGPVATLNGASSFEVSHSRFTALDQPYQRSMSLSHTATYENLQIDTASHQILGGTITLQLQITRDGPRGSRSFTMECVVTFQGDGTATIVLDRNHTFDLRLDSGVVQRRPRK